MSVIRVFETGSGKWIRVEVGGDVVFTSDYAAATLFDLEFLRSCHQGSGDFCIYKRTMRAVPAGTNREVWECDTVEAYLKERPMYEPDGYSDEA
jgi:hypothetical protein